MTSTTKFAADEVVVCRESFAFRDFPVVLRGERRRGSDALVREAPHYWVPDGTPENEWSGLGPDVIAAATDEDRAAEAAYRKAAKANPVLLCAAPLVYRASRDLIADVDGKPALVREGSTVSPSDPLRFGEPDAWEPVEAK